MTLRYAYNTNGCAHHRLEDAIAMMADAGYDGVSLTLDIQHLDPFAPGHAAERACIASMLRARKLGVVIETGARFLLDPRQKHEPTLVTSEAEGRERRLDFLTRSLEVAADTGAEVLTFWAGRPASDVDPTQARDWMYSGVGEVLRRAERLGVPAAFEPEPDMIVGTVTTFAALAAEFPTLRLALDLGHCLVSEDVEPEDAIISQADRLGTVHIEDMKRADHKHLPFGEGDMDLPAVLGALKRIGFDNLVCVELSSDSHRAVQMIPQAREALRAIEMAL
jgi:sugar phosphate isomerase/epimerase